MLDKLADVEKRYMELEEMMSDPQLLGQQKRVFQACQGARRTRGNRRLLS